MKALSIRQPWAWLICKGIKDVENRNWHIRMPPLLNYPATPRRIYVHAGQKLDDLRWDYIRERVPLSIWQKLWEADFIESLPLGAVVGEVDIVGCKYRHGDMNANLFSPWHEMGMYGFLLANPVLYDKAIPCNGKLGFFEPDIRKENDDKESTHTDQPDRVPREIAG